MFVTLYSGTRLFLLIFFFGTVYLKKGEKMKMKVKLILFAFACRQDNWPPQTLQSRSKEIRQQEFQIGNVNTVDQSQCKQLHICLLFIFLF